ncbi:MFS transporter [Mesorhizobium sp. L48C026A00]|nr:MFS transporter [Mesorhizobium sp. L48C026A00]
MLPVNVISPSLPNIAGEFKADPALINLAVAGYAIVTALVELISGAISDRFRRRPVALVSIVLFIVASVGCALAPNITVFLVFRAAQAGIAACFSVALVAIKETSADHEGASRMGYAAMAWALAPMLGPTFGGVVDELLGWRMIFVVLALLGVAVLFHSMRELKETGSLSSKPTGTYLSAYRQLLGSIRFWAYVLCMGFSTGTLYILAGAPIAIGGPNAILGLYMGMVPAGFICGSYLTGRIGSKIPRGALLISARLLTCAGLSVGLILATTGVTHALAFFGPCMFIGIGNGLTMPAANMGAMSVRERLAGTAAGLAAAMSIGGGAVIVSVAGLFLDGADAVETLLSVMLGAALLALLTAILAAVTERRSKSGI